MTTGIVITAAGRGERFIQAGGRGNKLNAGFADAAGERRSLFEHTLRRIGFRSAGTGGDPAG